MNKGARFETYLWWGVILAPLLFTMNASVKSFGVSCFVVMGILAFMVSNSLVRETDNRNIFNIAVVALGSFILTGMNPACIGSFMLLSLFLGLSMLIGMTIKRDFDITEPLMWCCIVGMLSTALEICGFSFFEKSVEAGGLLGNAPQLAMLLCITIPFIYSNNKWIAAGLAISSLALGEMTGAVAFGVTAFINKDFKMLIPFIGLLFFIPQIVQAFSIRFYVWGTTLLQIAKQPLTGYGPGMFDVVSGQFISGMYHAETSFSSILQMVFNCGIFMLIAVWIAFKDILNGRECVERTALIVIGVLALIEYPFEIIKFWFIYATIIGLFLAKNTEDLNYVC